MTHHDADRAMQRRARHPSSTAAARACGVAVDQAKAMNALQAEYDQDPMVR